ncbi:hypothetical protein [Arcticibacter sp. MXS-1]|uniref:hypothetical protein n=1 Tax=Arcticibacter sp. MXS-1 TaxID=3341726 RepID=UPI0035A8A7B4
MELSTKEKLEIFARYIGKHVWVECYENRGRVEVHHRCGLLKGVKEDAILVATAEGNEWMPFDQSASLMYRYRLLLHPLSRLTEDITATANNLPASGFISQYYIKLGFDMPVFIAPDHPGNCKTVAELGLADYRSPREIVELNYSGVPPEWQTSINL